MLRSTGALGTVLGIWAHPDDEAYLSGGLMAEVVGDGGSVVCVTATRGEAGFPLDDATSVEDRKAVRTAELDACLAVLGVREHHWLEYADGACADVPKQAAVERLAALLDSLRPDTVLTFGPDGMTGHRDHIAVSRWTTIACARARPAPARLLYATKTPSWNELFAANVDPAGVMMEGGLLPPATETDALGAWFHYEGELLERKIEALRHQESQTASLIEDAGIDAFRALVADEYFRPPWPGDHVDEA